ncbi:MAG: hypothetical protein Q3986_02800 [Akkermansia sp.]|nr:hypothetical protein [Akkermansia sp.]
MKKDKGAIATNCPTVDGVALFVVVLVYFGTIIHLVIILWVMAAHQCERQQNGEGILREMLFHGYAV